MIQNFLNSGRVRFLSKDYTINGKQGERANENV